MDIFISLGKVIGVGILMVLFGDLLNSMRRYETPGERLNNVSRTEEISERT